MISSRERVGAAISRRRTDRIPRGELCIDDDLVRQVLKSARAGFEERAAFIAQLGLDLVTLAPAYPAGAGVPEKLADPLPDLEKWVLQTPYFVFALLDGAFGWGTRLMDYLEFLMLHRSSPLEFKDLIDGVEKLNRELIISLVGRGVDGIIIADDIAYRRGLMISPLVLRELLFPALARQVSAASGEVPLFFHSDGNYSEIIPDLVHCGFRGLQCLERQAGMDPLTLKRRYPEMCFWGTLEVEDLERAEDEARLEKIAAEIHSLSAEKGFILGTTCGLFNGIDLEGLSAIHRKVDGGGR
ncbi:MAG: hypothetical protein GX881_08955 [Firmicutes bacterium]|nr:hypothetical protein [Bacillota bacterium]